MGNLMGGEDICMVTRIVPFVADYNIYADSVGSR